MSDYPDAFERKLDDTEKQDERKFLRRAAKQVNKFIRKSQRYREPYLKRAKQARELYNIWSRKSKSPIQRANLQLPFAYLIVQQEIPQIAAPFLKENPPFKLIGQEPQDFEFENAITDFVGAQVRQMGLKRKYLSHVEGNVVEGTSVAKVPYRFEERVVTERASQQDPETGETFETREEVVKVTFDGPDFDRDWETLVPSTTLPST